MQGELDPRLEGLVEGGHSVRGEDEHPIVVFECSEKDCGEKGALLA